MTTHMKLEGEGTHLYSVFVAHFITSKHKKASESAWAGLGAILQPPSFDTSRHNVRHKYLMMVAIIESRLCRVNPQSEEKSLG